jgi:tetratricopeptide (TPR) repeat protein
MLWGANTMGIYCLALDEILAYAESLGRVMTTAEFRRRRQQLIDAAAPLERAKFTLGMRQFGKAKAALQQALDADPRQPEALILMGYLHDRECLDQPDEAIKNYRRAAALEDNPNASYSGMFYWRHLLENLQRWKELADLCEAILQRFPRLDEAERQRTERLRDSSRRQLNETHATQPPRTEMGG